MVITKIIKSPLIHILIFKVIPLSGLPCRHDNKSAFLMQIIVRRSMTTVFIRFAPNLIHDFANTFLKCTKVQENRAAHLHFIMVLVKCAKRIIT